MTLLRYIPNLITLARIASVGPVCWLLWTEQFEAGLGLLVVAGLSDALDGYLARRYHWFSEFGALLDPVADKLFIVSITLVFGLKEYLPWWLVWLVLGRDVLIMGGALLYRWVTGVLEMRPLRISKLNTALQITLLAATLLHVGFYALPSGLILGLEGAVALTTVLSGAAYVYFWTRDALLNQRERHENYLR